MGPQLADLVAGGDVRFEVHHFPLRQESLEPIKAVECAGEQGYWWAMHDHILENQSKGIGAQKTVGDLQGLLKQYAADLQLDTAAFNQCYEDEARTEKLIEYVVGQAEAGSQKGVRGTPSFLINGEPLSIQTLNDVAEAVKKELNP